MSDEILDKEYALKALDQDSADLIRYLTKAAGKYKIQHEADYLDHQDVALILKDSIPCFKTDNSMDSPIYFYDFESHKYTAEASYFFSLVKMIDDKITRQEFSNIWLDLHARSMVKLAKPYHNKDVVTFKNCLYDAKKNKAFSYGPEYFITQTTNTIYNPKVELPVINGWNPNDWLNEISNHNLEIRNTLLRVILTLLTPFDNKGKAIFLVGPKNKRRNGANGKSTFEVLLESMAGSENTAYLSVDDFAKRFRAKELQGKILDIGDDLQADSYIKDSRVYNGAITADKISSDVKNQNPISFTFYGLVVQSTNGMPKFKNRTGGTVRRIMIVPFLHHFDESEINEDIKNDYLKRDDVKSWFANEALKLGQFDSWESVMPKESKQFLNQYLIDNDPISSFADEVLTDFKSSRIPLSWLYKIYHNWAVESGYKPMTKGNFKNEIIQEFSGTVDKDKAAKTIAKADKDQLVDAVAQAIPTLSDEVELKRARINLKTFKETGSLIYLEDNNYDHYLDRSVLCLILKNRDVYLNKNDQDFKTQAEINPFTQQGEN